MAACAPAGTLSVIASSSGYTEIVRTIQAATPSSSAKNWSTSTSVCELLRPGSGAAAPPLETAQKVASTRKPPQEARTRHGELATNYGGV